MLLGLTFILSYTNIGSEMSTIKSLNETTYLLKNHANARRLLAATKQLDSDKINVTNLARWRRILSRVYTRYKLMSDADLG